MAEPIEIRVRDVRQLFESMDPTPFPGKDLDANAARFIVGWARELPTRVPLHIRVHIENPGPDGERIISEAVANYFNAEADASRREFGQLMAIGRRSLAIGLAFLSLCLWTADLLSSVDALPQLLDILRESLIIGGWVALWRPLEIFLYEWWPLRADRMLYERLANAAIELA